MLYFPVLIERLILLFHFKLFVIVVIIIIIIIIIITTPVNITSVNKLHLDCISEY